jgi:hypothetical protein
MAIDARSLALGDPRQQAGHSERLDAKWGTTPTMRAAACRSAIVAKAASMSRSLVASATLGGEAVRDHDRLGAAVGHEASSFRARRAGLLLGAIEQK